MPLVFAVLVIIVIVLNAKDSKKRAYKNSASYEKNKRKTNAKLEQKTMDMYTDFSEHLKIQGTKLQAPAGHSCVPSIFRDSNQKF